MTVKIVLDEQLIIPFGRPKWDINQIKVVGVSTNATYLESSIPCVYINKKNKYPIRLTSFTSVFPVPDNGFPKINDASESLKYIREYIKYTCQLDTFWEKKFLDIYFEYCQSQIPCYLAADSYIETYYTDCWFNALLPLPQAHIYVGNPLDNKSSYLMPDKMCKIDFAFWNGNQIIAVEIDGDGKQASNIVPRDRMLEEAGIQVIHILNSEIDKHGTKIIGLLLPHPISSFLDPEYGFDGYCGINPLDTRLDKFFY